MSRSSLPPLEDDFTRALLGSAEADAPSNAAYVKAASALGIGVGLGVGASLPAPAALAAGAASLAGATRWSSSFAAKLLAFGVSGTLLVGGGALLLRGSALTKSGAHADATARSVQGSLRAPKSAPFTAHPEPAAPTALGKPPLAPSADVARSASLASALEATAGTGAPGAPSALRRVARPKPARAASNSTSKGSSLSEQVQSLDRARVALGAGDAASALREIAHYRAAWPQGVFLTEASVLEIEALAARGERSLAAARAAEFVALHPDSPQANRLRALIPAKTR